MKKWTIRIALAVGFAGLVVACAAPVDAPEATETTASALARPPIGGGGGVGIGARPCLKCEGCDTSHGWNACCSIVEVDCSVLKAD